MKVCVIGLGQMGGNMALTLQKSGFNVVGSDVSDQARKRMQKKGVTVVEPEQIPQANIYLLSLPTSTHVEEVVFSKPGLLRLAPKGSIIADTSTSDPESSKKLASQILDAGLQWLDAPVSGGPQGAATGTLGMLLGGSKQTIKQAQPVINALAAKHTHVGGPGAGHIVKLANNFLCAAHLVSTAQAVAMAKNLGVSPEDCLAGINSGSGRSAVSEVNFPKWVLSQSFDSGFTMGLMRKDLNLAYQASKKANIQQGVLDAVLRAWQDESSSIDNAQDFNCIVKNFL